MSLAQSIRYVALALLGAAIFWLWGERRPLPVPARRLPAPAPLPPEPVPAAPLALPVAAESRRDLGGWALLFILLLTLYYGRELINFDPSMILSGREVEWTLEADVVAWKSLLTYRELPLWNPYWYTGRPFLADPFFHGLDPKMFIPQALFGPLNGSKIGVLLSFVTIGVGGWLLGRVMRLGAGACAWLGAMLALSGQMVSYYSGVGSVGLGLSFSYVPWVLAASIALWQRQDARRTALFALAGALLFLGSNFYFLAYTAIAMGIVVAAEFLWAYMSDSGGRRLGRFLLHVAIGGALAVAVAAVVALPQVEVSRYLFKPPIDDLHMSGQPLESLLINFFISDQGYYAQHLFNMGGLMIGRYSYLGLLPFVFLFGAPLAWQRGHRRAIVWLTVIGLVGLFYAAGNHTPIWSFFRSLPGAASLRFPERTLGLVTISVIALAALGLQMWWQRSAALTQQMALTADEEESSLLLPVNPLQITLVLLAIGAIVMAYRGNIKHLTLSQRNLTAESAVAAVKEHVGEREFHLFVPTDSSLLATSLQEVGQVNPTLVWQLDRKEPLLNWVTVSFHAAEYALVGGATLPPEMGPSEVVADYPEYDLHRLTNAMPYAFTTALATPPDRTLLAAPEVTRAVEAQRLSPRRIRVEAEAGVGERLVVAESMYPGWTVTVDGEPAELEPFNGFLSLPVASGRHRYEFYFNPLLPKIALLISLLALPYALGVALTNNWLLWPLRPAES